jgi:plastocyanin
VELQAGRGQQLHPGEAVDTVVYFVPAAGAPAPATRDADVVTAHRDFRPSAIALPLGSTLHYVNRDTVRHNVFSVTPGAAFNLGYQAAGRSAKHVFAQPGLVLVSCNVHHSMEMDVFVVPSRYASRAGADGRFTLHGLPPGPGELVAWNPRARLAHRAVTLPAAAPVVVPLLAERPRVVTEIGVGGRP